MKSYSEFLNVIVLCVSSRTRWSYFQFNHKVIRGLSPTWCTICLHFIYIHMRVYTYMKINHPSFFFIPADLLLTVAQCSGNKRGDVYALVALKPVIYEKMICEWVTGLPNRMLAPLTSWQEETRLGGWRGRPVACSLNQQDAHCVSDSGSRVRRIPTKGSHGSERVCLLDVLDTWEVQDQQLTNTTDVFAMKPVEENNHRHLRLQCWPACLSHPYAD